MTAGRAFAIGMVALMAVAGTFFPLAAAAPKLMVYDVVLQANPPIQGPDLPISLSANVGCGGACCYVVYGSELKAEILLPENWTLLDGNREQWLTSAGFPQGTVAAQPGGGLTWVKPQWEISGPKLGTHEVAVRVTGTNDAGDRINFTGFQNITLASGAAISMPVFPHRPVAGKETILLVNVSSRKGVNSVNLHYSEDNKTWTSVAMNNLDGDAYRGVIPAFAGGKKLNYYMESLDKSNETFRTGLYPMEIKDPGKISGISSGGAIAVTAGSLLGLVLILYLGSRRMAAFRSKGIFLVGDARMEAALRERDEMAAYQKRMVAMRWRLLAAVAAVTLVLLIVGILTGQMQKVIEHTTNPGEAIIWLQM